MIRRWTAAVREAYASAGVTGALHVVGRFLHYGLVALSITLHGNTVAVEGYRFSLKGLRIPPGRKAMMPFTYEIHERDAIRRYLDPAVPVIEFGGGIGVVACLTNMRLVRRDQHVVVEANPDLIPLIEDNRNRHACAFTVVQAALGYGARTVSLYRSPSFRRSTTKQPQADAVEVETISLERLIETHGFEQVTVICDIEGAEVDLVEHESDVLARHVRMLIAELHPALVGAEAVEVMRKQLETLGFHVAETMPSNDMGTVVAVFENTRFIADPT